MTENDIGESGEEKAKAIQFVPDTLEEREEIERAASKMKQSLASFSLYHTLQAARIVNRQ